MNELMNVNHDQTGLDVLTGGQATPYVSFNVDTKEDKLKLYNAMNSPEYRLADMINKPIKMVDALLIPTGIVNQETGEYSDAVRSIIIDDEGRTYAATATGIMSSLRNLYNVFGSLHFDDPLTVVVKQVAVKRGNTLTLVLG